MFAIVYPKSIRLVSNLSQAVLSAVTFNQNSTEFTARVFQPDLKNDLTELTDIIEETDDSAYRRKLSAIFEKIHGHECSRTRPSAKTSRRQSAKSAARRNRQQPIAAMR